LQPERIQVIGVSQMNRAVYQAAVCWLDTSLSRVPGIDERIIDNGLKTTQPGQQDSPEWSDRPYYEPDGPPRLLLRSQGSDLVSRE
jgi:hypothetical protein